MITRLASSYLTVSENLLRSVAFQCLLLIPDLEESSKKEM